MERNKLNPFKAIVIDDIGGYEYEVYTKADVDDVLDDVDNENKALRHNLEDWKAENKALKQRIKELEANQPKWISVKDKLPEEGVSVLCSNGYGVMFISSYNKNLMHFVSSGDFDWVTHWMPLPSAPKSED